MKPLFIKFIFLIFKLIELIYFLNEFKLFDNQYNIDVEFFLNQNGFKIFLKINNFYL